MTKIDPHFADELKKYGAKDFDACFNCGNCSAVCSHSEKTVSFPRMTLRLGMLGLKKDILSSVEPWLCYSCGDCTETCPRQAGPGQYLAAVRRYAISEYEPTGLTRLIFKNPPAFVAVTMLIAVFLGFFLFTLKPEHEVARWIFNWLPYDVIHNLGLVIFGFTGLSMAWGVLSMIIRLNRNDDKNVTSKVGIFKAIWMVLSEAGTMDRYKDCDAEEDSHWRGKPWYIQPWFVHWSIMWGFIGLLVATSLDFIFKDPATTIWWPSRILGTISGLFMIFGTSQAINYRWKKVTLIYSESSPADWTFLWFLWIAGITGFWLETSVALGADNIATQLVFLVHTIISMELVLLFAFSKFAHAFYRPIALFYHYRNQA